MPNANDLLSTPKKPVKEKRKENKSNNWRFG